MSGEVADRGRAFWIAYALGAGLMAWGVWLLVETTSTRGERLGFGLWVVLADVLVDWVAVPVIGVVAWMVTRWAPRWSRVPVQVGLILSGTVLLVAWLPLRGTASGTGNPTIQPLDYPVAVTSTLAVIWVVVALWAGRRWWRSRG